jgi:RNA polymerase sigma-70 factor (ECF subfamily)
MPDLVTNPPPAGTGPPLPPADTDRPAFAATPEQVFREYAPRIYNIARRLLGNDADAEDVTSDVLVQVVRKLHTYRGDAALPTWLHRVTVNAALAHREKRANRLRRETAAGDEALEAAAADTEGTYAPANPHPRLWSVPPDSAALARERREIIEAGIGQLPEPFRDVYVLADVEGLPNADIADILGLSVAAVKSRLHRARLRMRDLLAPHFEEVAR